MITTLGGVAGSGKSLLIQYLLQLRQKQSLIDTHKGDAVFLTGMDSSETEIRRRAKSIGKGNGLFTVQVPDDRLNFITNESFYNDLCNKVEAYNIDAIVFDTLADFHEGNLYEAADANATMSAFRRLATATGAAIILITHTRKSADMHRRYTINDIADSRIFGTKSDFVFAVKNEYKDDSTNLIELQCLKSRSPRNMPDLRALVEYDIRKSKVSIQQTDRLFSTEAGEAEEQVRINSRRQRVKELHSNGESLRNIADELNVSHETIRKDLQVSTPTVNG